MARALTDRRSVVVSTLGITQTLAWGSTYYLTAVFADPISADLHISREWFYGAVSVALLLSGLLGPFAGRMIVLAAVFGASWFVSTELAAHLPRLLEAVGTTPALAIAAASLVGPAQVAARLIEFSLLRRVSPMISARP